MEDQPEQERNVADASERCPALRLRVVALGGDLAQAVAEAARALVEHRRESPTAASGGETTEAAWRQAFTELAEAARMQAASRLRRQLGARLRPVLGPETR